jgi:hypothetical protein
MKCNRVMFVVEYEDGRTAEFSIDQWTLSLGDYAARIIARERQTDIRMSHLMSLLGAYYSASTCF